MILRKSPICSLFPAGFEHSGPGASKGFSIVELMISLVLIAIGAALALPSYSDMIEKRHLSRGAEQLLAFVNSAQSEAIKWNETLNVSYARAGDNEWCVGANLGDSPCDCTDTDTNSTTFCDINDAPWIFDDSIVGDRVLLKSMDGDDGGDDAYSFNPERGLLANLDDRWDVELHSRNQAYQVNLLVSRTGQAILCSKDSNHQIPGYKLCPADGEQEAVSESAD